MFNERNETNMSSLKIFIGGDFVPTDSNLELFKEADINTIFGEELCNLLHDTDYRIFNLEAPITISDKQICKSGPNLKISPASLPGIVAISPSAFSLANNHIMDYGEEGFLETVSILGNNSISFFGAGNNLEEARKPFIITTCIGKIAFYSCTENEFSIAGLSTPGANPYDPLCCFDDVVALKNENDYVIILFHGGAEHYRYPLSEQQRICKKFVEKGADMVICQHSHCIGCEETYLGKKIIYGQGNFIFDFRDNEYWITSLGLILNFEENNLSINYYPILKNKNLIELLSSELSVEVIKDYLLRSEEIQKTNFIANKQVDLASRRALEYLRIINGMGFILKVFDKLTRGNLVKSIYRNKRKTKTLNVIRCDSLRELLLTYLNLD